MVGFDPKFLSVMARIGCRPDVEDPSRGSLLVTPEVCEHGVVRPSVLMLLADTVVGMKLEMDYPEWTFTTDYSFRSASTNTSQEGELITAHAWPLRLGKRLLVEGVDYHDHRGELLGHSVITFIRTPLREGDEKPDIEIIRKLSADPRRPRLRAPFAEETGIELVDGANGHVQLVAHDGLRRPGGFIQGSIMTLLGEVAAQHMAEAHHQRPCTVKDLDVRYLIGGRSGPLVTSARWIGPPQQGTISVDVRDQGHDNVVTTTFLARVEPA